MKKTLADQDLDGIMRTLVCDAGADDELIREIADSQTVWWGVKRQIALQRDTARSPWPPANVIRRWLTIGVPVTVAAALLVSILLLRPVDQPVRTEMVGSQGTSTGDNVLEPPVKPTEVIGTDARTVSTVRAPEVALNARSRQRGQIRKPISAALSSYNHTEVRSAFISLSYAPNPESGQIVRVRVPSSMMVSLGLVANVEKPAKMVDAEVLVGDDGTTHAIRFVR